VWVGGRTQLWTYALASCDWVCVTGVVGCGCLCCKWYVHRVHVTCCLSHVLRSSWQIKASGTDVTCVCPEKSPHGSLWKEWNWSCTLLIHSWDFRLPSRCSWGFRASRMLRGVAWHLVTDVSGQPVGPVLKGSLKRVSIEVPEISEINYQHMPLKYPRGSKARTHLQPTHQMCFNSISIFKCMWSWLIEGEAGAWKEAVWTLSCSMYRSFATRVSQLKIWHFWVTGTERNVCRCTFNRCSVITQFENSPLESSCVVVAFIENYSASKPLNVSPKK
jgi:hypothetical protein